MMFLGRFFMEGLYSSLYPITSELYPTSIRSLGYGFSNGVGKIGAFLMPLVLFPLMNIGKKYAFLVFVINSGLSAYYTSKIPFDTTGKDLKTAVSVSVIDEVEEEKSRRIGVRFAE